MKRRSCSVLVSALALAGLVTAASVNADTITEKTTTYSGTVTEVNPSSSTIILRSQTSSAPTTYTYNKETVFVDPSGNVVSYDVIKDSPVTVSYRQEGDRMIVTKVEATGPRVQRRETTTTTETR